MNEHLTTRPDAARIGHAMLPQPTTDVTRALTDGSLKFKTSFQALKGKRT